MFLKRERQLAHTEPNSVRRTYNHADYFSDRAKMMCSNGQICWIKLLSWSNYFLFF